jgi:hypothetical protein
MTKYTEKEKQKIYDHINWVLNDIDQDQLMEIAFQHFEKYYFSLDKDELINQNVFEDETMEVA